MWANAQCDGRPAKYRWHPLLNDAVWLTPAAGVQCSDAASIGECNTWTQSEFCTWQYSVGARAAENAYILYSVQVQEMAKHRA